MAALGSAQMDKASRPSPAAKATCALGDGKTITVDYSSPRAKGRKIFGGLVPYGEVWRAGANEATTFVTTADLMVGGSHVPAGSYTIFTIPNQDKWTLIISKKTGEWGIPYPGADNDLVRVDMKVSKLPSAVENPRDLPAHLFLSGRTRKQREPYEARCRRVVPRSTSMTAPITMAAETRTLSVTASPARSQPRRTATTGLM